MQIVNLRTCGLIGPLGLDIPPVFSWNLATERRDVRFSSARLVIENDGGLVWDSGDVEIGGVPEIAYSGPELDPKTTYRWRVTVRLAGDEVAVTSDWATFDTGLLGGDLEDAAWISLVHETPAGVISPVQYFRREFRVPSGVRRARAYSTALGWYHLHVNGRNVSGPGYFPGFTAFEGRVEYQVRDITADLIAGDNVVALVLADGRYRGRNSAMGIGSLYGNRIAATARLEVEMDNGDILVVNSNDSWEGGHGRIRESDIRSGEVIDARIRNDWDSLGGSIPEPVEVIEVEEHRNLVGVSSEPVLAVAELPAIGTTTAPSGTTVIDFGQNLLGTVRLRVSGPAGSEIRVAHSEVLTASGEVDVSYLLAGLPMPVVLDPDTFILSGGSDVFQPSFSTQGFRFAGLTLPEGVTVEDATAIAVTSDFDYHGSFECSDPLVTKLHENIAWSMRGNFFDVPTDCPTRERSGWTGDAETFAPTALLVGDARNYLSNWLVDLGLQQREDGLVYDIVPHDFAGWTDPSAWGDTGGFPPPQPGSAGWGDAVVMIPWTLYQATGSAAALERSYASMRSFVEFRARQAAENRAPVREGTPVQPHEQYLLDTGFHFGEWLEPQGEGDGLISLTDIMEDLYRTPRSWVATAYFAHSSRLLSQIASILGKDDDAARFARYADGAKDAWQKEFIAPDGRLIPDAQASYVRALEFNLLPSENRPAAAARLVERIRQSGNHLGTGFLSTGFLLPQLARHGYADVALDILLQDTPPSWIYQIQHGATTTWETWHGYTDDGEPAMSHNHYSFGSVGRFLYEGIAGIRAAAPGWTRIAIEPLINDRITSAAASTGTPFGRVAVGWKLHEGTADLTVDVPAGTEATVKLPGAGNGVTLQSDSSVSGAVADGNDLIVKIGSGHYTYTWQPQIQETAERQLQTESA